MHDADWQGCISVCTFALVFKTANIVFQLAVQELPDGGTKVLCLLENKYKDCEYSTASSIFIKPKKADSYNIQSINTHSTQ